MRTPTVIDESVPSRHINQYYSEELADRIADLYIQGKTLSAIAREPMMPSYSTLLKWVKDRTDFRSKMQAAKFARALTFEDQALELGTSLPGKDEVASFRLAVDTLKWVASVNDPATYGNQTKVTGDANAPLRFIISTGFPEPTPGQEDVKLGPDGLIIKQDQCNTDGG